MNGGRQTFALANPEATTALGAALAAALGPQPRGLITLRGELGAGKTHLVRSLLRALGETGPVKSPTYTLVEPYEFPGGRVMHLDLYRLADVDEWWALGLEDDPPDATLWCVEWPEKAAAALPPARLSISLAQAPPGRVAHLEWADADDPAMTLITSQMKCVL